MFSPQIPVTTCSRQVRGMSCSPSRRWDSVDFCGKGKKTKLSCEWSSLEFWNDSRSLFIYNWCDQTQVCIPGGIPVTWAPTFSLVGQKPRLDYSPPGLGFGGSNMSHYSTNNGSITCLDESSWGMNDTLKLVHINFPQRSSWLFSALMHFFTKFTSLTTISPDDK